MTRAYEKHGMHKHPLYKAWSLMNDRCRNQNSPHWQHYGARGITVCDRWASFPAFVADMGVRPEGATLDRINNDGPYSPDNCRWATKREQNLNRRALTATRIAGVNWAKRESSWRVRAWSPQGEKHLGYFADFFEACCARKSAELQFSNHS